MGVNSLQPSSADYACIHCTINFCLISAFLFFLLQSFSPCLCSKTHICCCSQFQHPHIIRLLGYTAANAAGTNNICLIYEMGSRGSVGSILRGDNEASLFTWRDRMHVAHGVVSALNYLHCHQPGNPVYHRDVKSDNVVVTADYTPKVIDCGLAKYKQEGAEGTGTSITGAAVGTPGYMCRAYMDSKIFDAKSEIYSVGIFFLELLTGQVQRPGISLYGMYMDDEEDIVADQRAGNWQYQCVEQMGSLARECLNKPKKRISTMTAVLRSIKTMLDKHCQLTDIDKAKARELLMMQQEKDEARIKGVLADRLETQLREQAQQLMAVREAEREAQARREKENQDKADSMRRCAVCWDDCDKNAGVTCCAGHFLCPECLNAEVKEQVSVDNMWAFKKANLHVKCRTCTGHSLFDISQLTRYLDEDCFLAYLRMREDVLVRDALTEQEERAQKQIEELQRQMQSLAVGREADVLRQRMKIIEEILTLKCPRANCRRAFVDFTRCFALTCSCCSCHFCAYCLKDCGDDAHQHVVNCKYNIAPGKSVFASLDVFEHAQQIRRTRMLKQYFADHVDAGMRAQLIEAMELDFEDIGINSAELL